MARKPATDVNAPAKVTPTEWIEKHADAAIARAYRDELPPLIARVVRDLDEFVRVVPLVLRVGFSGDYTDWFRNTTVGVAASSLKATANDARCWIGYTWDYYGLLAPPPDQTNEQTKRTHVPLVFREEAIQSLPPRLDGDGNPRLPKLPHRWRDGGPSPAALPAEQQLLCDILTSITAEHLYELREMAEPIRKAVIQLEDGTWVDAPELAESKGDVRQLYPGITHPDNSEARIVVRKATLDRLRAIAARLREMFPAGRSSEPVTLPPPLHAKSASNSLSTASLERLARSVGRLLADPPASAENLNIDPSTAGRSVQLWARDLARDCEPLIPSDLRKCARAPTSTPLDHHFREPDDMTAARFMLTLHRLLVNREAPSPDINLEWGLAALDCESRHDAFGGHFTIGKHEGRPAPCVVGYKRLEADRLDPLGKVIARKGEPAAEVSIPLALVVRLASLCARRIAEVHAPNAIAKEVHAKPQPSFVCGAGADAAMFRLNAIVGRNGASQLLRDGISRYMALDRAWRTSDQVHDFGHSDEVFRGLNPKVPSVLPTHWRALGSYCWDLLSGEDRFAVAAWKMLGFASFSGMPWATNLFPSESATTDHTPARLLALSLWEAEHYLDVLEEATEPSASSNTNRSAATPTPTHPTLEVAQTHGGSPPTVEAKPSAVGVGVSVDDVRAALELMVKNHDPFTSLRGLAKRLGCHWMTIRKAITGSPILRGWKARHKPEHAAALKSTSMAVAEFQGVSQTREKDPVKAAMDAEAEDTAQAEIDRLTKEQNEEKRRDARFPIRRARGARVRTGR